ncbi:hypothetical protein ACQY0O_003336 [Thecaphora frezii]
MSYASVAAHNAPPESEQPKPDPTLLEGQNVDHSDVSTHLPDVDSGKVNVIPSDADLEHLKTESQEAYEKAVAEAREARAKAEQEAQAAKDKAARAAEKAEQEASQAAEEAGDKAKDLADDAQSYAKDASQRAQKLAGDAKKEFEKDSKELKKKASAEAKKLKKKANEAGDEIESFWNKFSSNPDYWVPALGALNVALLGGVGFYAYTNKEQVQRTDRRLLSAVTVGLLGLLGGQGYWAQETARKQRGSK